MSGPIYHYVELDLAPGPAGWASLRQFVRGGGSGAAEAAGGELLGVFAPQIGFRSNEAVLLQRWAEGAAAPDLGASRRLIEAIDGVLSARCQRLVPVLRAGPHDALPAGGIWAHRWFTLRAENAERFADLSGRAWTSFEETAGTKVFGLFACPAFAGEAPAQTVRMLLITWYADHGAWQRTRDPAPQAKALFAERHALTLETVVRTSVRL